MHIKLPKIDKTKISWKAISVVIIVAMLLPVIQTIIAIRQWEAEQAVPPEERLDRGLDYLEKEDYNLALYEFNQALAADPEYAPAYLERGKLYLLAGEPGIANANLSRTIQWEADNSEAYYYRALTYLSLEELANQASAALSEISVVGSDPDEITEPVTIVEPGLLHPSGLGEGDKAIALEISVDETVPPADEPFFEVESETVDPQQRAINDLNQALQMQPDYIDALRARAQLLFDQQKYGASIEDLNKVIESDPNDIEALTLRAHAHYAQGNFTAALEDFDKVIAAGEESLQLLFYRGGAFFYTGDTERAIQEWSRAIEIDPQNTVVLSNRALAYRKIEDLEHALQDYQRIIALEPKADAIHKSIGDIHFQTEEYQAAIDAYSEAISLNPEYASVLFNRGVAHLQLEHFEEALADFEAVLALEPGNQAAHKRLGDAHYLTEQYQKAIKAYLQTGALKSCWSKG